MQYLTRELLAKHRAAADRDIAAIRAGDAAKRAEIGRTLLEMIQTDLYFGRGDFIADVWQLTVVKSTERLMRRLDSQDN